MINHWLSSGTLVFLLGMALGYDVAFRRIPNWLVGAILVGGLVYGFFGGPQLSGAVPNGSARGLANAVLGAATGFAVMLPLYLLRTMGGGDVKLMAAVGAFLSPIPTLGAALLTFVAGGLLALIAALWSRSLISVWGNLKLIALLAIPGRSSGTSMQDVQSTGRLPYALAIATGTGLQFWLSTQEGWPFK